MSAAPKPRVTAIEPPYGLIWDSLKERQVVPFLGAGASFVGRDANQSWTPAAPFPPSGSELAEFLAEKTSFPSRESRDIDDLAKVASYFTDVPGGGRKKLRSWLRSLLNHRYQTGAVHQFLASLDFPQVIVVTNYDTLLEEAFQAAGKPYDLVIYPAGDLNRKDIANAVLWWPHGSSEPTVAAVNTFSLDLDKTTVIFKMHGTVMRDRADYDSFVITEEDYIEFLGRMTTQTAIPAFFIPYFSQRSFLFLGYGLRDWNLRVVLRNITKVLNKREEAGEDEEATPSWAIQYPAYPLDRALWQKRGVEIYEMTVDDFVAKLNAHRSP